MAKNKSWINKYEITEELGEGGNAKVYRVKSKNNGQDFALKVLGNGSPEKRARFIDEIEIMKNHCEEIDGIIPILDFSTEEYWYAMPIAQPIMDHITKNSLTIAEIISGVIELCQTLELLHEKGISHRDIKPSNIYYYKERFYFGDFGLVDFPENENDFTRSDRGLGAIFTIAPEMKRNPKNADGKKADVFSMAKTVWMFLTKDEKGFDGVYDFRDPSHSLRYIDQYKDEHIVEIEDLFKDATNNKPEQRPTIKEFKERLIAWIEIYNNPDASQASDWNFLNKQLFGPNAPESSSWRDLNKIVEVLNTIGRTPAYNHMLFHNKGGLDFSYAEMAAEEKCIKIYDSIGFCHIVKPQKLYFEGFEENYRWNYFLLELDQLTPIFEEYCDDDEEYLVEDSPAHYVSARFAEYGVYDFETGIPLPKGYQTVYRYTKGKFLIVMKNGPYNAIHGAYDGRHGDCSASEFREYMEHLLTLYLDLYSYVKQDKTLQNLSDAKIEDRILSLSNFNRNPYKRTSAFAEDETEIHKMIQEQKKTKEFIKQNFMNWDFSDLLQDAQAGDVTTIKFVFRFSVPDSGVSLRKLLENKRNYISCDGRIREMKSLSDENCFFLSDRKSAIELKRRMEDRVREIINENSYTELEKYESCFTIKLVRCGTPTHLFTKSEIEMEMRNADDRVWNQLVINENGYARVIQNDEYGYLFPVRHESWNAGHRFVGKYSDLSTLDNNYISSLQGWLLYLQSGRSQHMDYVHDNNDEEKLLEEISQFY